MGADKLINVFTKSHMLTYFKNSIIVLIGVLIPLLLFALMAGFALSKIKFKGRKFVLNYFLLGLMLPMQVALIPLFTIFNKMGLINTYPAIILPQIAFSLSYSIQLFYSFSKFFPEEMLEAAIIDGCSPIGCFFKMVVPMSLNSIITVATMQAVFCWNEYINAYTFTRSTDMKTITLGLNDFVGSMGLTDWWYICSHHCNSTSGIYFLLLQQQEDAGRYDSRCSKRLIICKNYLITVV